MKRYTLTHTSSNDFQTIGKLTVGDATFHTLELPWKNNQKQVSRIPKGTYIVARRTSPKYGEHFYLTNVPNRDLILIHHGNYYTDIKGCILVGLGLSDINKDGNIDVTSSKAAMAQLLKLLPKEPFELEIT